MAYHNWNELSESTQRIMSSQGQTPHNRQDLQEFWPTVAKEAGRLLARQIFRNPVTKPTVTTAAVAAEPAIEGPSVITDPEHPHRNPSLWNPVKWGADWLLGKPWKPDWMKSEQIVRDIVRNNEYLFESSEYLFESSEYLTEDDKVFALLHGSQQVFFEQNGRYASPEELNEVLGALAKGARWAWGLRKPAGQLARDVGSWLFTPKPSNYNITGIGDIAVSDALAGVALDAVADYNDSQAFDDSDDEGTGEAGGAGGPGGGGRPGGNTVMPIGSDYVGPRTPGGGRRLYN